MLGLEGVFDRRIKTATGAWLVSIKVPGHVPLTFSSYCLPNRTTLVTVAEDQKGRLSVHQYLLPIRKLSSALDEKVRRHVDDNPLSAVRAMAISQKQFALKRSIEPEKKNAGDYRVWMDLINSKWLDPVMSLIAAYDMIRQRGLEESKGILSLMLKNLRLYFAGIPDIEAIAKMLGCEDWQMPQAPPLLLEGLLAFGKVDQHDKFSLPANKLDYGSPWTSWIGAVNDFEPLLRLRKAAS